LFRPATRVTLPRAHARRAKELRGRAGRVSAWRGARRAIRRARLGTHLSARQWQIVSTARKLPVGTT
jgi:hypothetical protein